MKTKAKNIEKGITLIALIITIIVLLILAGVTITYVFGDNSILKIASDAKLQTDIAKYQEMLETAKTSIIIEGLGTFDPDKYFTAIQSKGITTNVIDNEDGTYDVTTKPGYVFLVTLMPDKEKPVDAEIEYLGQTGKLMPKLKGIVVTGKTKTSIDIKIAARLEGGSIKAYWKKASEVAAGEAEENIDGYQEITLDDSLAGTISELATGEEYKIKAILEKDGEVVSSKSINVVTRVAVSSITLDPTSKEIIEGKTLQIKATVNPENAENQNLKWSVTSGTDYATVDQTGLVTGKVKGEATIRATSEDVETVYAECRVNVIEAESDWAKIAEIAEAIEEGKAKDSSGNTVTNNSNEAIVGDTTISVGDTFKIYYGEGTGKKLLTVRVLGFMHDHLVDSDGYGENDQRAGISFEFVDFLGSHRMHSSNINTVGWKGCEMRSYLNGSATEIGGEASKLKSIQSSIKKVTKPYLLGYSATTASTDCSDWLWFLSCSEVGYSSSTSGAAYGYAKAKEGETYKYYIGANNKCRVKISETASTGGAWWLRSPICSNKWYFCFVSSDGSSLYGTTDYVNYVAPGFCI